MADETTYESEMNTPAHRPGMEGVVNRGGTPAPDARDSDGNRTAAGRPSVGAGKTDPFSVKGDGAVKGSATAASSTSSSGASKGDAEAAMGNKSGADPLQDAVDKDVTG